MHLLVVDDDEAILQLVSIGLGQAGYSVLQASNAQAAIALLSDHDVQLAIVDVMMPGMDGFELAKILIEERDVPVILLTARSQIQDKEKGFQLGIDDYIVKPFETKELLFRVQALLRRYQRHHRARLKLGNVKIDRNHCEITIGDKQYIWPVREFEILTYFMQRAERHVNRWNLIDEIWGESLEQPEFTLNTHINRIRERLKRSEATVRIATIRGFGYKLEVAE